MTSWDRFPPFLPGDSPCRGAGGGWHMRTNYGSSGAQALPPSQAPSAGADDVTSAGKESILACALGIKGSGGSPSKRHPLRTRRPPAEWWPAGDPRLWEGAGPWEPLVLIWDLSQPRWGLCQCLWGMAQLRSPVLAGGCPREAPVRWLGERSSQTRPCLWVRQPRDTLRSGERIRALGAAGVTKAGVGGGVKPTEAAPGETGPTAPSEAWQGEGGGPEGTERREGPGEGAQWRPPGRPSVLRPCPVGLSSAGRPRRPGSSGPRTRQPPPHTRTPGPSRPSSWPDWGENPKTRALAAGRWPLKSHGRQRDPGGASAGRSPSRGGGKRRCPGTARRKGPTGGCVRAGGREGALAKSPGAGVLTREAGPTHAQMLPPPLLILEAPEVASDKAPGADGDVERPPARAQVRTGASRGAHALGGLAARGERDNGAPGTSAN